MNGLKLTLFSRNYLMTVTTFALAGLLLVQEEWTY